MKTAEDIVRFYSGTGTDDRGRTLKEIQEWPDDSLEDVHDFIQWMFPLVERSGANPDAPTLDPAAISRFRSDSELQQNLYRSFVRMLGFYGLEMRTGHQINVIPDKKERVMQWMWPGNHNYLRITRILKSLSLLGLENDARGLFDCLSEMYAAQDAHSPLIPTQTFRFWKAAVDG